MQTRLFKHQLFFYKMFFFDKFTIKNSFQCHTVKQFAVKVPFLPTIFKKFELYKLLVTLYLLSGQKPKLVITYRNIQGLKKIFISNIISHIQPSNLFIQFLIYRSLALKSSFAPFVITTNKNFGFVLKQKTQDDDILSQLLNLTSSFSYHILVKTDFSYPIFLQALLYSFKIPCRL